MEALQADLDADEVEFNVMTLGEEEYLRQAEDDRIEMKRSRNS